MEVKGIAETIAELRKFGKDAEAIINAETEDAALTIEAEAKRLAPANFGKLRQSISHQKVDDANYRVTVNEMYGAYIEFGTGHKVKVPEGFEDIAASFKSKGGFGPKGKGQSFQDGLDSITEWCHAKGIPILMAKWIFLKILGAGINPQPFLYPAWVKGKNEYLEHLKKALDKLNKKI